MDRFNCIPQTDDKQSLARLSHCNKNSDATYAVQVYINRNLSFSAVVEDLEKLVYTSKGHA